MFNAIIIFALCSTLVLVRRVLTGTNQIFYIMGRKNWLYPDKKKYGLLYFSQNFCFLMIVRPLLVESSVTVIIYMIF